MILHDLLRHPMNAGNETIATGFREFDKGTGGLRTGKLCTIGARPGMGKTAFTVSLLRNIGVIQKVPTAFLTLELSELEILKRIKASIIGGWDDVSHGSGDSFPTDEIIHDIEIYGINILEKQSLSLQHKAQIACEMMKTAPVWIEHDVGSNIDEIISYIERMHQEKHVQVFIIDSLHWIMYATKYAERSQAIMKLYLAASRLGISMILTTNLGLSVERRGGSHRPTLGDAAECGPFELYSSMLLFIYRPEYYHLETFEDQTPAAHLADIMIEKNSFGGIGLVRMDFNNHAGFMETEERYFPF